MNEIILYSTDCPNCKMLKLLLEKHGVAFVKNKSVEKMIEMGFDKVPVLKVDNKYMNYNEAKKWIENIGR